MLWKDNHSLILNQSLWFRGNPIEVIQSLSIKRPIGNLTIWSYFVKSFYNIQNISPVTCNISKLKFYINDVQTPMPNKGIKLALDSRRKRSESLIQPSPKQLQIAAIDFFESESRANLHLSVKAVSLDRLSIVLKVPWGIFMWLNRYPSFHREIE